MFKYGSMIVLSIILLSLLLNLFILYIYIYLKWIYNLYQIIFKTKAEIVKKVYQYEENTFPYKDFSNSILSY